MTKVFTRRKISSSTCSKFLNVFVWCFIAFNIILFCYLYANYGEPECSKTGICHANKKDLKLPREKLGEKKYNSVLREYFNISTNEWRLSPISNLHVSENLNDLNCSSLKSLEKARFIAAGYTKSTYKVKINNRTLSLKTVNVEGHDVNECLLESGQDIYDCILLSASKLLKELVLLRSISHSNIVKVLGYCVPIDPEIGNLKRTVLIFEEYGEPVEVIKLLQLSWEERLKISLGLARLLMHLSTFKEAIALNDFRRQQFILVDGEPKLIDVDDIGIHEHTCDDNPCCLNPLLANHTICVSCIHHKCQGYNEKMNIIRMGRHFIRHILPYGAPNELTSVVKRITDAFSSASWRAARIWKETESLVNNYSNGLYKKDLKTHYLSGYKFYDGKDVSSNFDYRCQLALSGYGCSISVFNAEEAAEICWTDSKCKAFIWTDTITWTGRRIVMFKNGFGNLLQNERTKLYIKL